MCVYVVLEGEPILILRRQVLECLECEVSCLQLTIKFFNNHKAYMSEERRTGGDEREKEREGGREGSGGKGREGGMEAWSREMIEIWQNFNC